MVREIITPHSEEYTIKIPKEYIETEVEILILPFSYDKKKKEKDLSQLLEISTWDIKEEDVKVKDWEIQGF